MPKHFSKIWASRRVLLLKPKKFLRWCLTDSYRSFRICSSLAKRCEQKIWGLVVFVGVVSFWIMSVPRMRNCKQRSCKNFFAIFYFKFQLSFNFREFFLLQLCCRNFFWFFSEGLCGWIFFAALFIPGPLWFFLFFILGLPPIGVGLELLRNEYTVHRPSGSNP